MGLARTDRERAGSRSESRWRTGGTRAAALVAAGLAVLLALVLLHRVGPLHADRTEHPLRTAVLPALTAQPLVQELVAAEDGLSQVTVRFATGDGRARRCAVEVRLIGPAGPLGSRRSDCRDLHQAQPWSVTIAPVPHSAGMHLRVEARQVGEGLDPIALWGGPAQDVAPAMSGDTTLPLAVEVHTSYGSGSNVAGRLSTVLGRIDGYGPFWHEPIVVVLLAIIALACLIALAAAGPRLGLALVVVLAVAKGVLWSVVIPPLAGPDEPAHFSYVQFLAEQHRIPQRGKDAGGDDRFYSEQVSVAEREVFHQNSSSPGNRPDFTDEARAAAARQLRDAGVTSGGDSSAAGYAPHYYLPGALVYTVIPGGFADRLAAVRLWNVALGALAAALAVGIGRRLFPDSRWAPLALGVAVALQPMLSQQMAVVNNDGLVIVAGFWCLLIALDLARPGARQGRLAAAGVAGGLALLGKPFGVAFVPVLGGAWWIGRIRSPQPERRAVGPELIRAGAGFLLTYGAWWAFATIAGYPSTSISAADPEPVRSLGRYVLLQHLHWFAGPREHWITQLWGRFGYLTFGFPSGIDVVLTVATLAALVLVAAALARAVGRALRSWRRVVEAEGTIDLLVCAGVLVLSLLVLQAAEYLQFRSTGRLDLLQGRYLLMALPALLALPSLAWRQLGGSPRSAHLILGTITAGVVALQVVGLALVVGAGYS